ncbi:MAG: YbjQ family protein, partial [Actinobacteria bacterium]
MVPRNGRRYVDHEQCRFAESRCGYLAADGNHARLRARRRLAACRQQRSRRLRPDTGRQALRGAAGAGRRPATRAPRPRPGPPRGRLRRRAPLRASLRAEAVPRHACASRARHRAEDGGGAARRVDRRAQPGSRRRGAQERAQQACARATARRVSSHIHLSGFDFAALRRAGFRPIGQVLGTCVYRIGWQRYPTLFGSRFGRVTRAFPTEANFPAYARTEGAWSELDVLTEAYNDARRSALTRMREQARELGATAVIGVRYRQTPAPTLRAHQFIAVGTAITSDRYELDETEELALTNLSGTEFLALM